MQVSYEVKEKRKEEKGHGWWHLVGQTCHGILSQSLHEKSPGPPNTGPVLVSLLQLVTDWETSRKHGLDTNRVVDFKALSLESLISHAPCSWKLKVILMTVTYQIALHKVNSRK